MSEFMMSEGLKRIILRSEQSDEQLWNTVARLYRTYGAEPAPEYVAECIVCDAPATLSDDRMPNALYCSRHAPSYTPMRVLAASCADCNGCGIRYYRSGDEPCGTCGGTGEVSS